MTEKLEELLAAEFRNGAYDLPVDAAGLTTALRRRRARRTAAASVAGVALAATAGVAVIHLVGPGAASIQPAGPAVAFPASAPATVAARRLTADSVQLGDAVVRGLPASAELAADPDAALALPPIVELPRTGNRAVVTVPSASGTPIRLVVVVDAEDRTGLPGVAAYDQDWLSSLGGAHALLTVDGEADTTYLSANTVLGRRWHLAATGPDAAARLALVRSVAVATVPGG